MPVEQTTRSDSVLQVADEKNATLKMTLKTDSGFRSQSEGERISANQWRDINLVIEDDEAYRKMRTAVDMFDELEMVASGLHMLIRAIDEGDPRNELRVRADDMKRETKAMIAKVLGGLS